MELLNQIIKHTHEGIIVCDCHFNFLIWNDAMEEMTGLKSAEMIGTYAFDKLPNLKRNGIDAMMHRALKGESVDVKSLSYMHAEGPQKRWLRILFVPQYKDNSISGIIGFVKDITRSTKQKEEHILLTGELKEKSEDYVAMNRELMQANERHRQINEELKIAKEKAEEGNRLKTAFLENLSHEIRTPMNAIVGFSNLLEDKLEETNPNKAYTRLITQQSYELLGIIDQMLEMSSIEIGQVKLKTEVFDIRGMLDHLFDFFEKYKNRRGKDNIHLNIREEVYLDQGNLTTDKYKLRQVFKYLLENAFKFTEEGTIEFGVFDADDHSMTFFVSDTGIGIPENQYDAVFEKFRQIEQKKYAREGLGLGLSIVKGLVSILGGEIWLRSNVPHGTTFYFSIQRELTDQSVNNWQLPEAGKLSV